MMEFEQVLLDPKKYFEQPSEVVAARDLSKSQKLEVLRRWQDDAEQLQEAATEGMTGGEQAQLQSVREAMTAVEELPG